jgi:type I site-specific restriction endonuclease
VVINPKKKKQVFDFYDLFHFVKKEEHKIEAEHDVELDTQIFKNAIELPNIKVRNAWCHGQRLWVLI